MTRVKYPWIYEYSRPEYWDKRSPLWIGMPKLVNLYIDLNDNKVRRFLASQKGRILDAGCGSGRFLQFADVGVDFSQGMLRQARNSKRDVIRASILRLPFRNGVFSLAFSVDVMLHLKPTEQLAARKELDRVGEKVLVLLGEHRTVFAVIYQVLRKSIKKPRRLLAYLALLLAFPVDRFTKIGEQ